MVLIRFHAVTGSKVATKVPDSTFFSYSLSFFFFLRILTSVLELWIRKCASVSSSNYWPICRSFETQNNLSHWFLSFLWWKRHESVCISSRYFHSHIFETPLSLKFFNNVSRFSCNRSFSVPLINVLCVVQIMHRCFLPWGVIGTCSHFPFFWVIFTLNYTLLLFFLLCAMPWPHRLVLFCLLCHLNKEVADSVPRLSVIACCF